jgi:hypothetical protein
MRNYWMEWYLDKKCIGRLCVAAEDGLFAENAARKMIEGNLHEDKIIIKITRG